MIFHEPAHPSAIVEPTVGNESQGGFGGVPADSVVLAYQYMDEDIEDVMIDSEASEVSPHAAGGSPGLAGRE